MFITGLGTATPAQRYTQLQCWEALQRSPQFTQLQNRSRIILKKVLTGSNGIASRHLALESLDEAFAISPDILHARFSQHAPALATQAAERALIDAKRRAVEIDAVIVSTCTGYLCPGLTSYVSERLGLRPNVLALDLVGQGCGAALPNLRTGEALLNSGKCQHVLSICVEVCSAAFFLDDDPGVLVSACLFGDGAAAAVLSNKSAPGQRGVQWKTSASILSPKDRDLLRFEQRNGLLRNILSPCVPLTAAKHAKTVLDQVLGDIGLAQSQISGWILHAGGRDVLSALQESLELQAAQVRWSATILERFGNLSSPFVLFVLQAALAENTAGGRWWMSSFGAGFSCHGALLEVE
jgi:predicted naringenin-chalcone synthase